MLIRFVVSNFLSFSEEREFSMIAGSLKTHKHHVYDLGKLSVLKAAAIYGANGAGKSNFIKSIDFFKHLVNDGLLSRSINDKKFKLDKAYIEKPVSFEIEFYTNKKFYAYGITIQHTTIVEEWLYESGIKVDDKLIFERKHNKKTNKASIKMADKYIKTQKAKLLIELMEENLLKSNELLLAKADNLKMQDVTAAFRFIRNNIVIIYPESRFSDLVPAITTSESFRLFANDMLKAFDTGVNEISTETVDFEKYFGEEDDELKQDLLDQLSEGKNLVLHSNSGGVLVTNEKGKAVVKKVVALHNDNTGNNVVFDLDEESNGTQRLLDFIPAFDQVINDDITIIIDEIDQSIHPALLKALVEKLMGDESTKGQFIFTTHESNLLDLDLFRQDEIWFAEKDKQTGGTQLYSLSEFKPRYDLDIRKGYLKGRFGGIPFLANLSQLNWHEHDAKEEGL
jgi:AAA15 family ATPase/GTPase